MANFYTKRSTGGKKAGFKKKGKKTFVGQYQRKQIKKVMNNNLEKKIYQNGELAVPMRNAVPSHAYGWTFPLG